MRGILWQASIAAASGDVALIELLLDCGVSLTRETLDGRSVLHVACAAGRVEIVRLIAEKGHLMAECALPQDRWGRTPIDDARYGALNAQDDDTRAMYQECEAILAQKFDD